MWKPGDRVTHRFHSELGTGRIVAVQGRSLKVKFPEAGQELSFAAGTDALVPLAIVPGGRRQTILCQISCAPSCSMSATSPGWLSFATNR